MPVLSEDPEIEATVRAARGAAHLDAQFPGWEAYIDVEALDLYNGELCVLGQLGNRHPGFADIERRAFSSSYADAVKYLCPSLDFTDSGPTALAWPLQHGFLAIPDHHPEFDGVGYERLLPAWKAAIGRRQERFAVRPSSTLPVEAATRKQDEAFRDEYEARGIFADSEAE